MKNKKELRIVIAAIVFILIAALSGCIGEENPATEQPTLESKFEKKISESTVTVDLTPRYSNGKLYVDISVNTHSVELSAYDLREIATLEINDKMIKPTSAPKLEGHHSSGTLIFDVGAKPENFVIKIRDRPDIKERVFRWP